MGTAIRTRIVRIGNSQGIRIPKPLLEQSGISEEVEEEAFATMARQQDDALQLLLRFNLYAGTM